MLSLPENLSQQCFDAELLGNSEASWAAYREAIALAQELLISHFSSQSQPYSGKSPEDLAAALDDFNFCPKVGKNLQQVLQTTGKIILNNSVVVSHPACVAHLHCPPAIPALAAEVLISGMNQSMDSWDQSAVATHLEQRMIRQVCDWFGYGEMADGIFTSGGTQSNFMGLLLARDRFALKHLNWSIQQQGLPPEASRFRILCSEVAHFTVRQAAAQLGLGEQAVVAVATDTEYRMSAVKLRETLQGLKQQGYLSIAIVATAGTTDFGSIDPLEEIGEIAQKHGVWLHVDAAYGGALAICDSYSHLLRGIDSADSIAVDFHKLFYQPISCGAFLLKNRLNFELIRLHADYLNPESHSDFGMVDLVTKSVQTTRRFDGLKLFVTLQAIGQKQLAEMIEATIKLARSTANLIKDDSDLELANFPTINAVVFRYLPRNSELANSINQQIRLTLLRTGEAVIAQTQIDRKVYLKFTLLNPHTTLIHVKEILQRIKEIGQVLSEK